MHDKERERLKEGYHVYVRSEDSLIEFNDGDEYPKMKVVGDSSVDHAID